MTDDKKVTDIKEHAHKILKENIGTAERVVQDMQSQLEQELGGLSKEIIQERIHDLNEKLYNQQKEISFIVSRIMQTQQKIKDLEEALIIPQFNPPYKPINEEEVIDMSYCDEVGFYDEDTQALIGQNDVLDELEKQLYSNLTKGKDPLNKK